MKFAYIDPGSGSMILQMILGGLAAAAVFLKMFWHRVLVFLHIRKPERPATDAVGRLDGLRGRAEQVSPSPSAETPAAPRRRGFDPGSFRDWDSRVFLRDGRVFRALSADGLATGRRSPARTSSARRSPRGSSSAPSRGGRRRPGGRRRRRGARARARPVRLVPVRVALLDAPGRGALQLELLGRGSRRT